jgi:hypothetical protein
MNTTDGFDPARATTVKPHGGQQVDDVVSGVGHEQPIGAEQRVGDEADGSGGVERGGEHPGD